MASLLSSQYVSGRVLSQNVGIAGYSNDETVITTVGSVGINTNSAGPEFDGNQYSLFVNGPSNLRGFVGLGSTGQLGIVTTRGDLFVGAALSVKDFIFFDEIQLDRGLIVGVLTVSDPGRIDVQGGADIIGVVTLRDPGFLDIQGGIATITGNLIVDDPGVLSIRGGIAEVLGILTIGRNDVTGTPGNLIVEGDALVSGFLSVGAGATLSSQGFTTVRDLFVSGVSTFVGVSTFESQVAIGSDLIVSGITTLSGIVTTGGDLFVGNNLSVRGDLEFDEFVARNALVTGITTLGITSIFNETSNGVTTSYFINTSYSGDTNDLNLLQFVGTASTADFAREAATVGGVPPEELRVGFATTAANIAAGDTGFVPYQYDVGLTTFLGDENRDANNIISWNPSGGVNGNGAPVWSSLSDIGGNQIAVEDSGELIAAGATTLNFNNNLVVTTVGSADTAIISVDENLDISTLNVSGISSFGENARFAEDVIILGDLFVTGTGSTIFTETLIVEDKKVITAFSTDTDGNLISNDFTATGGGIAVASTEGTPLADLTLTGINTDPNTYKSFLWFEANSFPGFATDAFISNYAISVGTTENVDAGTRLAVGTTVRVTDSDVTASRFIGVADTAVNIADGLSGDIPYQENPGITSFLSSENREIDSVVVYGNNAPVWSKNLSIDTLTASGVATALRYISSETQTAPTIINGFSIDDISNRGAFSAEIGLPTEQELIEFNASQFRSVEFTIQANRSNGRYQMTKIMAIHNDSEAFFNEYGTITSNEILAIFDVRLTGGQIELFTTATDAGVTTYKVNYLITED